MKKHLLKAHQLIGFRQHLIAEEKSTATVEKYLRDARAFFAFVSTQPVTKNITVTYKAYLQEKGYALRSINSMLASLNSFLDYLGWNECRVKPLRFQRQTYSDESKVLTKEEYMKLLSSSREDVRLQLLLQTICSTGIRVSELKYITVEAAHLGEAVVRCKNKTRTILIPDKLQKLLLRYAQKQGITDGSIFVTCNGNPLDRSNIWAQMKKLCSAAGVEPSKVFPHNLRKLFARTFYSAEKDIAKLADILGHGSIETTRIYIMTTVTEHRRKMERLGLVVSCPQKEKTT